MVHKPRKRFGQNFLRDQQVISEIIYCLGPESDDHIVEIGPGKGALTEWLLKSCDELDVMEIDRDLVHTLKKKFATANAPRIHCCDALQADFSALMTDTRKLRIIGNLPYNISTPLIFHLLEQASCISDMHFMLQKEVVERICANPGSKSFGRLSVMTQYICRTEHLFDVGPECFDPQPRVTSSIVRLSPEPRPERLRATNPELFAGIVKQAFSQRRKTLRNGLKAFLSEALISSLDIDPGTRAETLSVNDFVRISNCCSGYGSPPSIT